MKTGGIYKTVDSDSYIIIIAIRTTVYYYQVLNATSYSISINQQYIIDNLNYQINEISLSEQHDFFLRTKKEILEKSLDGYLGIILNEQLYKLQQELKDVEFDENGYGYWLKKGGIHSWNDQYQKILKNYKKNSATLKQSSFYNSFLKLILNFF